MKTKIIISSLFFVLLISGCFFVPFIFGYTGSSVLDTDQDSWVFSADPDENYDSDILMYAGYNTGNRYALIGLNVTDLVDAYNYGFFDDDVHLRVYGILAFTGSGLQVDVFRITSEWNASTVTWNTKPTISESVSSLYLPEVDAEASKEFFYFDIHDDLMDVLNYEGVGFYGYMLFGLNSTQMFSIDSLEAGTYEVSVVYGYDEEEEEEEEGIVTGEFLTNWFMYAIFLVVLPIAMTAYISNLGEHANPTLMLVTFLGSETLMSAISLSIGLIDIWFMLVVIIVDILLILGLMKGG